MIQYLYNCIPIIKNVQHTLLMLIQRVSSILCIPLARETEPPLVRNPVVPSQSRDKVLGGRAAMTPPTGNTHMIPKHSCQSISCKRCTTAKTYISFTRSPTGLLQIRPSGSVNDLGLYEHVLQTINV